MSRCSRNAEKLTFEDGQPKCETMSKPIPAGLRAQRMDQLHQYMSTHSLKSTRQRDLIVQLFFDMTDHVSVEELYEQAKGKDPNIGFATVYRTMKMLTQSGLAHERNFGDGRARFENTYEGEHHDHMICMECGEITEFDNEDLNSIKHEIAQRKGFKLHHHKMELYGICRKCQKK